MLFCLIVFVVVLMFVGFVYVVDQIKVGLVFMFFGFGVGLGVDICDGFNLVMKYLNGKFGGLLVEVLIVDDQ